MSSIHVSSFSARRRVALAEWFLQPKPSWSNSAENKRRRSARFVSRPWQTLLSLKFSLTVHHFRRGHAALLILQKRKTTNKPRDATTPHGATAAESVRNLIKKNPRYSKRINYDALRDLFDGGGPSNVDEKIDAGVGLWTLDPEKDDEDVGGVVIEEGGGGVGMLSAPKPGNPKTVVSAAPEGGTEGAGEAEEELYEGGSDKEDYTEWEGYEQEV